MKAALMTAKKRGVGQRLSDTARFELLLKARSEMTQRALTYAQLSKLTGLPHRSVAKWINQLRQEGDAFVAGWAPDIRGRLFVPMFQLGKQADAPRPGASISDVERMRRYRQRQKATAAQTKRGRRKKQPVDTGIGIDDLI